METKVCIKCGKELPLSEFHKNKGNKDGLKNMCKECCKEYNKQYRQDNREAIAEQHKQYYKDNKEAILEQHKQYYKGHNEELIEYAKQYRQTPMGRALCLANGHRQHDKQYNRGECTLTAQWIVENIFTKSCHWCGETDWHKLGCDRIDNDKPHTPDNVNPCCEDCNKKRGNKTYEEFLEIIKKATGEETDDQIL